MGDGILDTRWTAEGGKASIWGGGERHSLGGVLSAAALSDPDARRWLSQMDDTVRTASTSLSSDAASSPSAGVGGKSSRRAA